MKKKWLYWIFQITGWSIYAVIQIAMYYIVFEGSDEKQILIQFLLICFNVLITHLFRKAFIKWGMLRLKWVKLVPAITLGSLLLGGVNFLTVLGLTYLWDPVGMSTELVEINSGILEPSIFYFFWSAIYFTFHYFERYNKSLQYEVAINEFELNNLKTQLNPHFIFNALNSIRALVDEDPKKSKVAITQLSNILRSSLILDKKKLISFEEEIKTVKDYLELESVRYEERLQVFYNLSKDSSDFNVPPMMIQTLVENGIKHGVSKLTKGGAIAIKTQVVNHTLLIQIRNSGRYNQNKTDNQMGFGLQNTIRRLDLIYGEQASFSIKNESDDTVLTEIIIPETI